MNISREQFVQTIEAIIKQEKRDDAIAQSLGDIANGEGYPLAFYTPLVEDIVKALDYDGIISWWLWDGPAAGEKAEEFAVYLGDSEDSERRPIRDSGELYDYIMEVKGE